MVELTSFEKIPLKRGRPDATIIFVVANPKTINCVDAGSFDYLTKEPVKIDGEIYQVLGVERFATVGCAKGVRIGLVAIPQTQNASMA